MGSQRGGGVWSMGRGDGPTVRGGLAMSCDRESVTSCQDLLAMRAGRYNSTGYTKKRFGLVCQLLAGLARGKSNQGETDCGDDLLSRAGGCIVARRVGGTKIVEKHLAGTGAGGKAIWGCSAEWAEWHVRTLEFPGTRSVFPLASSQGLLVAVLCGEGRRAWRRRGRGAERWAGYSSSLSSSPQPNHVCQVKGDQDLGARPRA